METPPVVCLIKVSPRPAASPISNKCHILGATRPLIDHDSIQAGLLKADMTSCNLRLFRGWRFMRLSSSPRPLGGGSVGDGALFDDDDAGGLLGGVLR